MFVVAIAEVIYEVLRQAIAWITAVAALIGAAASITAFLLARGSRAVRIVCVVMLLVSFQFGVVAIHIFTHPLPPLKERLAKTVRSGPPETPSEEP